MPIPNRFHRYFWDTDPSTIDAISQKHYVIARLLRLGDSSSWKWVNQQYDNKTIITAIQTNKEFTKKDRNFYSLIYHLSP